MLWKIFFVRKRFCRNDPLLMNRVYYRYILLLHQSTLSEILGFMAHTRILITNLTYTWLIQCRYFHKMTTINIKTIFF